MCVSTSKRDQSFIFENRGRGGGGGGGWGRKTRPLEKVLEVRHRGAAQPSVRSNKASVHILQTCIHAVNIKKVPRKTKVHGDVLSNGLISTSPKKCRRSSPSPHGQPTPCLAVFKHAYGTYIARYSERARKIYFCVDYKSDKKTSHGQGKEEKTRKAKKQKQKKKKKLDLTRNKKDIKKRKQQLEHAI